MKNIIKFILCFVVQTLVFCVGSVLGSMLLAWDHLRSDADYYFWLWLGGGTEMIYWLMFLLMALPMSICPDVKWMKRVIQIFVCIGIGWIAFNFLRATWALSFGFLSTIRSIIELIAKTVSPILAVAMIWSWDEL